jgi:glycosyltransferase involved in cell wall biosynthesis
MRILFLHNNFPAQFGPTAASMADDGDEVVFATGRKDTPQFDKVRIAHFEVPEKLPQPIHPFAAGFDKSVVTGLSAAGTLSALKKQGFSPDVAVAHSGWGPGMFVKDIWPDCKFVGYFEWYYRSESPDVEFMRGGQLPDQERIRLRARNAALLTDLAQSDSGICPTYFQRDQFPALFHQKLQVLHDGIDTAWLAPRIGASLTLPDGKVLTARDEVVTYVARGMEPYRGFPEFMAGLAKAQKKRPDLQAVVVGADRVAYGAPSPDGKSFKDKALEDPGLDLSRVHFTGLVPRHIFRDVLHISRLHVYLTVPFVLSWSMLEAMGAGCLLLASDTAPVKEAVEDGKTGLLVDFRDTDALAARMVDALENQERYAPLRAAARHHAVATYAAEMLMPRKKALIRDTAAAG